MDLFFFLKIRDMMLSCCKSTKLAQKARAKNEVQNQFNDLKRKYYRKNQHKMEKGALLYIYM